ncbi:MAG: TonB-dependent receptor [Acidobacteria bacterium]|nr:TonB-dependent receptor [Acidobacteriota bacterium]
MNRNILFAVLVSVSAYAAPAHSQAISSTTGAINGTVADSTKAVLPGVAVTLSGPAVMGAPAAVTDQSGLFRFPALSPGDYTLTFELSGFATSKREGIHVSLGFTATVNVEMNPASVSENITVSGASPVVDLQSTNVTTHFDAEKLATLPGSRDFWAVVAQAPAVSMGRLDVGGSGALTQQPYTAYGLSSAGGVNRGMVEGIMVNEGAGGGGSDMYYTDYGSYAEIAVNAVGNSAEMPAPGVLSQLIAKSGGNNYHGTLYADYETDSMEGRNIDAAQLAAGVTGSNVLDAVDTNRLTAFKDFNVDLGGYIRKDKLWWYGAYRRTSTGQRYPTLVDDVQETWVPVGTGKITYNLTSAQKFIGYFQHADKNQPDYLGAIQIAGGRSTPAIMHADTVWDSHFPTTVWKIEYSSVLSNALLLEVRAGAYKSLWWRTSKSSAPRVEDTGNNFVAGGVYGIDFDRHRPQVNGSLSYSRSGWGGSHNLKFGGEIMRDTVVNPFYGFTSATNSLSLFVNGAPSQVYVYQSPSYSQSGVLSDALYVNDTWQLNKRATLNLGLRWDRQQAFLPAQEGPGGLQFAEVGNVITWNNNWGPRLGVSYDVTGDGKTVAKASFGQFWLYPGADFASSINPNAATWYRQYRWTTDLNRNGVWDPGEESALLGVSGGSVSTALDSSLQNTFTKQVTTYVEREVAANFGVRTGFVWNGRRQVRAAIRADRPFDGYNVPISVRDPGPDGRAGTADDGATFTAYNLAAQFNGLTAVNLTTNLPDSVNSDYYTWEITATKRETGRWSLLASFAETWSRETSLGAGTSLTPNALINTSDGVNKYKTWQGKINATVRLPGELRVTPVLRHQSGTPFARTFVATLNYGNATILSEPIDAERTPNINVFDVRSEKTFTLQRGGRITGFFDAYNILNTNAEQALTTSSGSAFLRPVAITPPRVARIGVKVQW